MKFIDDFRDSEDYQGRNEKESAKNDGVIVHLPSQRLRERRKVKCTIAKEREELNRLNKKELEQSSAGLNQKQRDEIELQLQKNSRARAEAERKKREEIRQKKEENCRIMFDNEARETVRKLDEKRKRELEDEILLKRSKLHRACKESEGVRSKRIEEEIAKLQAKEAAKKDRIDRSLVQHQKQNSAIYKRQEHAEFYRKKTAEYARINSTVVWTPGPWRSTVEGRAHESNIASEVSRATRKKNKVSVY